MRILLCDDDPLITTQLKAYLQDFFKHIHTNCPDISIFSDGESLLSDSGEKDILFLDVEMPGPNGIYVGNELKRRYPKIIIFMFTSYIEYLDEAMRFHVFRYLSKPLDKQRLFRNLKDALYLYNSISEKLLVETKESSYTISTDDIICVEAQGRKVLVHTLTEDYDSIHPMQYWKKQLPARCFFQSHRSFIVNLAHVTDFDHSLIHLDQNKSLAYLTRRKYTEFKKSYLLYLESMR